MKFNRKRRINLDNLAEPKIWLWLFSLKARFYGNGKLECKKICNERKNVSSVITFQ